MKIDDVINAVILSLQEIFGDGYKYYPENIGQNMEEPCFYVQYLSGNEKYLVGNRYSSLSHFVIHGHVEDTLNKKSDLNKMATNLYQLEYIQLKNGDLIRLENRNSNIEDDVIIFYFDVNVHLIKKKIDNSVNMQNINTNEGVKKSG